MSDVKKKASLWNTDEMKLIRQFFPFEPSYRVKKRLRVKRQFLSHLDKTNQEHSLIYSLKNVYQKYLNGEALPAGTIKDGKYGMEIEDRDLSEYVELDLAYTKKYGKNYRQRLSRLLKKRELDAVKIATESLSDESNPAVID